MSLFKIKAKTSLGRKRGKLSFIFHGDRLKIFLDHKVTNDTTFILNGNRNPKTIDVIDKWAVDEKDKQQKAVLGIYELTLAQERPGDTLKLCLARQSSYREKTKIKGKEVPPQSEDRERERPVKFESSKDVGLITLKRVSLERGDWFGIPEESSNKEGKP